MHRIWSVVAVLSLLGCTRYSEVKTEDAVVEANAFAPAQSGTSLGTGVDGKGRVTSSVDHVFLDASYAVVLRCDEHHKRFSVQGGDDRHKRLWETLSPGQRVRITYREKLDRDGNVTGLDFINAEAISHD